MRLSVKVGLQETLIHVHVFCKHNTEQGTIKEGGTPTHLVLGVRVHCSCQERLYDGGLTFRCSYIECRISHLGGQHKHEINPQPKLVGEAVDPSISQAAS
jgi:hypothetical protein